MAKLTSPALRVDKPLVIWVLISVLFGLWMVYSATAFRLYESGLDSTILNLIRGDFGKQLIGVVLGGCLAVILSSLDPESTWSNQKYVISLVLISFLMLILVHLFGHVAGGLSGGCPFLVSACSLPSFLSLLPPFSLPS